MKLKSRTLIFNLILILVHIVFSADSAKSDDSVDLSISFLSHTRQLSISSSIKPDNELTTDATMETTQLGTLFGAPESITNNQYFEIQVLGDDVDSYRFSLDGSEYSAEIPATQPIQLGTTLMIDAQIYTVGSEQLESFVGSRRELFNNYEIVKSDFGLKTNYLVNSVSGQLAGYNSLVIEGQFISNISLDEDGFTSDAISSSVISQLNILGASLNAITSDSSYLGVKTCVLHLILPASSSNIAIKPIAANPSSLISIGNHQVTSGAIYGPIAVQSGSYLQITATAPDRTSQRFTLNFTYDGSLHSDTEYSSFFFEATASDSWYLINKGNNDASIFFNLNGKLFKNDDDLVLRIASYPDEYYGESIQRKVWRFLNNNDYPNPPLTSAFWAHSPALFINSLGFGYCDDTSYVFKTIMADLGFQSRVWDLHGHVVPEVFADGKWQMYDSTFRVYYLNVEGQVASVSELSADVSLITNPSNRISYSQDIAYSGYLSRLYSGKKSLVTSYPGSETHDMDGHYSLPAGSSISLPRIGDKDLLSMYSSPIPRYSVMSLLFPDRWTGKAGRAPFVVRDFQVANGQHTLSVMVKDKQGSWQHPLLVSQWTIDLTAPHLVYSIGDSNSLFLQADKESAIYYTTDETMPNINSNFYNGSIAVNSGSFIYAIAIDHAGNASQVVRYPAAVSNVLINSDTVDTVTKGSVVHFNATGSGGSGNYEYYYTLFDVTNQVWSQEQLYSENPEWIWDTTRFIPGSYEVQVCVRNINSTVPYDVFNVAYFLIIEPPIVDTSWSILLLSN